MANELIATLALGLVVLTCLGLAALSSPWPNLEKRKKQEKELREELKEFLLWLSSRRTTKESWQLEDELKRNPQAKNDQKETGKK